MKRRCNHKHTNARVGTWENEGPEGGFCFLYRWCIECHEKIEPIFISNDWDWENLEKLYEYVSDLVRCKE